MQQAQVGLDSYMMGRAGGSGQGRGVGSQQASGQEPGRQTGTWVGLHGAWAWVVCAHTAHTFSVWFHAFGFGFSRPRLSCITPS